MYTLPSGSPATENQDWIGCRPLGVAGTIQVVVPGSRPAVGAAGGRALCLLRDTDAEVEAVSLSWAGGAHAPSSRSASAPRTRPVPMAMSLRCIHSSLGFAKSPTGGRRAHAMTSCLSQAPEPVRGIALGDVRQGGD